MIGHFYADLLDWIINQEHIGTGVCLILTNEKPSEIMDFLTDKFKISTYMGTLKEDLVDSTHEDTHTSECQIQLQSGLTIVISNPAFGVSDFYPEYLVFHNLSINKATIKNVMVALHGWRTIH